MKFLTITAVFCAVFAYCSTAFLPEHKINQLQRTTTTDSHHHRQLPYLLLQQQHEEFMQKQQQQEQQVNETLTALHNAPQQQEALRKPPHQSYDKYDDVVVVANEASSSSQQLPKNEHKNNHNDEAFNEDIVDNAAANYYTDDDTNAVAATHSRPRRELSDWLIAPNTRWCGRGNTANGTYNHLGGASSADKCCRKHDHCQMFIPGMSNRYELFNYRPYTLSHCNCDRRFRTCLKMAHDEDANTIGKIFFNMVQTQCFILKTEQLCQQRAADGSCERQQTKQKAYLRNNKRF